MRYLLVAGLVVAGAIAAYVVAWLMVRTVTNELILLFPHCPQWGCL